MSKFSEIGVSDNFSSGASYLISEKNFDRFLGAGQKVLGRPDEKGDCSLFVAPNNEISKMLEDYPNSPRIWEEKLGIDENSLSDNVYRVNIDDPLKYGLSVTSSKTPGANDKFVDAASKGELPHTSGGISEGVLVNADNPLEKEGVGSTSLVCTSDMCNSHSAKMSLKECKSLIGVKRDDLKLSKDMAGKELTGAIKETGKGLSNSLKVRSL